MRKRKPELPEKRKPEGMQQGNGIKMSFEQIVGQVSRLEKPELIQRIKGFQGRFRLDFTDDYLNHAPADRLRHILLAAMVNQGFKSQ